MKSKKSNPAVEDYQVPALDRALSILELLAHHPDGMRMRELADKLLLPPNSVFRITVINMIMTRKQINHRQQNKRHQNN